MDGRSAGSGLSAVVARVLNVLLGWRGVNHESTKGMPKSFLDSLDLLIDLLFVLVAALHDQRHHRVAMLA